jgi:hypothetical protein
MGAKRRKKRKKVKFRQLSFKLTEQQYKALRIYCRRNKLTPIRYLKKLINHQIERFKNDLPPEHLVTPNQLELFPEEGVLG